MHLLIRLELALEIANKLFAFVFFVLERRGDGNGRHSLLFGRGSCFGLELWNDDAEDTILKTAASRLREGVKGRCRCRGGVSVHSRGRQTQHR